jgi:hypothetical protein
MLANMDTVAVQPRHATVGAGMVLDARSPGG